ncbi:MAG: phosphotransferase [Myxococcota bacterium]
MDAPAGPPAEVRADVALSETGVDRLVRAQHPSCAGPVRAFATGWDNALFRVGDHHLARMPRRQMGADNLLRERRCLPWVPPLPLAVPHHTHEGAPDADYPYPWALTAFHEGEPAGTLALDGPATATDLAALLEALHRPAPAEVPTDAARSMPLSARDPSVSALLDRLPDSGPLKRAWAAGLAADPWSAPPVWVHGDLHPFNLLTRAGRLSVLLDWGDVFRGDPAPDLAAAWMLLEPRHHGPIREQVDDATWVRGTGWAVYYGAVLWDAAAKGAGAGLGEVARRTLARLSGS